MPTRRVDRFCTLSPAEVLGDHNEQQHGTGNCFIGEIENRTVETVTEMSFNNDVQEISHEQ
jgi:hypothetical protein